MTPDGDRHDAEDAADSWPGYRLRCRLSCGQGARACAVVRVVDAVLPPAPVPQGRLEPEACQRLAGRCLRVHTWVLYRLDEPTIKAWHGTLQPGGHDCLRRYEEAVRALAHADHVLDTCLHALWLPYKPWLRGGDRPQPAGMRDGYACLTDGLRRAEDRLQLVALNPTDPGVPVVFGDQVAVACGSIEHARRQLEQAAADGVRLRSDRA